MVMKIICIINFDKHVFRMIVFSLKVPVYGPNVQVNSIPMPSTTHLF